MTVAEFIFDFLQKRGLETVYMVSGSSAMWLTDSLYNNKDLKAICTHHEQAAVMAADVYGRTRELPGAALVTIGPGATNAITGVAEAYTDSSPLFVISGQINSNLLDYMQKTGIRQDGTQALDLKPIVSPITKYFASIMSPEEIRYHMEAAWFYAMDGRRGPVWIDVPVDIQNKQIPSVMLGFEPCVENISENNNDNLQAVFERLRNSRKPLILAGGGINRHDLNVVVSQLHIPVVTSRMGIDRIESDSPYYIGRIGAYGQRAAHFAIQQADFILILGCRLSVSSIGYYPDRFGLNAYKVQVDLDKKELERKKVPINMKITMNTATFCSKLLNIDSLKIEGWVAYCKELQKKYPVMQDCYKHTLQLNSYYFTNLLTKNTPEKAIVIVDTGSVCNVVSQTWNVKKNQSFIISGGLSCMGFWAGAIGACASNNSVIAISGDGSVSMNIQEFATLKYNNLPIKLFVYNNNGYMLIRHNQHNYMNDRFLGVGPDSGLQTPDYCKVAEAYGLEHIRIEAGDDIEKKISHVFNMNGPVVCEVMLEQFGPMAPRIASKVMPDGSLKAAEFDDMAPFLSDNEKPLPYICN